MLFALGYISTAMKLFYLLQVVIEVHIFFPRGVRFLCDSLQEGCLTGKHLCFHHLGL